MIHTSTPSSSTSLLLLAVLTVGLASCASTTSTPDDFNLEIRRPETNEEKMKRVFGTYDPQKRSVEEGKKFDLGRAGNPEFSKSIERKEYPVHPYFKVRNRDVLRASGPIPLHGAREATMTADQSGKRNSWFQRTFRTGEADQFKKAFPKEQNPNFTGSQRPSSDTPGYGNREYWTEIIEDIKDGDSLSVEDVQALFSPY